MSGNIIIKGWLKNGRPIEVELPSSGNRQTDIADLIALDNQLSAAGILARQPQADAMEKSETVNYVLRSISSNEKGESPKIYLYTERFNHKFLHVYLNTDQEIAAFEAACGVRLDDLPLWDGKAHIERGLPGKRDREIEANYVIRLQRPVKAFYKQNPRWNKDLSDEDKKKIPRYLFVSWGARDSSGGNPGQSQASRGEEPGQQNGRTQQRRMGGQPENGGATPYSRLTGWPSRLASMLAKHQATIDPSDIIVRVGHYVNQKLVDPTSTSIEALAAIIANDLLAENGLLEPGGEYTANDFMPQTDRQTGGQTAQTTPPSPNKRLSVQTDSRQTSRGSQTAQTKQTDKRAAPVSNAGTRIEVARYVNIIKTQEGKRIIWTPDGSYSFTRDPFRDAHIIIQDDQWGRFDLGNNYNIIAHAKRDKDEKVWWEIQSLHVMGQAESEIFAPDGGFGAPPEFPSDEVF